MRRVDGGERMRSGGGGSVDSLQRPDVITRSLGVRGSSNEVVILPGMLQWSPGQWLESPHTCSRSPVRSRVQAFNHVK